MHDLGLFHRGGAPGADGPDWFVGDGDGRQIMCGQSYQAAVELSGEDRFRSVCLTVRQRFSHAENWKEPVCQRRSDLLLDMLIPFAEERAPFRVADDHITAAKIAQHRCRHFPGESPMLLPMYVLCAKADPGGGA